MLDTSRPSTPIGAPVTAVGGTSTQKKQVRFRDVKDVKAAPTNSNSYATPEKQQAFAGGDGPADEDGEGGGSLSPTEHKLTPVRNKTKKQPPIIVSNRIQAGDAVEALEARARTRTEPILVKKKAEAAEAVERIRARARERADALPFGEDTTGTAAYIGAQLAARRWLAAQRAEDDSKTIEADRTQINKQGKMAPIEDPDRNLLEQQIKDVIQDLFQVMVQVSTYDSAGRSSREVLSNEIQHLSTTLQTLHATSQSQLSAATPKPDPTNPSRAYAGAAARIPTPLINYVENGRNPDIYTREFIELVRRMNQLARGKQHALANFRDVLAQATLEGMPELRGDVERVVMGTGGSMERIDGMGAGGSGGGGQGSGDAAVKREESEGVGGLASGTGAPSTPAQR